MTVQDGGCNGDVSEDLVPLGEGLVGSKDGRGLLIAPGDELEEQVRTLNVHGKIADLVNDEHPVLGQDLELVRQAVLKMSLFQLFNELVAVDIVGRKAMPCGHKTQGGSQMGFAYPGRAKEDHVLPVFRPGRKICVK